MTRISSDNGFRIATQQSRETEVCLDVDHLRKDAESTPPLLFDELAPRQSVLPGPDSKTPHRRTDGDADVFERPAAQARQLPAQEGPPNDATESHNPKGEQRPLAEVRGPRETSCTTTLPYLVLPPPHPSHDGAEIFEQPMSIAPEADGVEGGSARRDNPKKRRKPFGRPFARPIVRDQSFGAEAGVLKDQHAATRIHAEALTAEIQVGAQNEVGATLQNIRWSSPRGRVTLGLEVLRAKIRAGTANPDGSRGINAAVQANIIAASACVNALDKSWSVCLSPSVGINAGYHIGFRKSEGGGTEACRGLITNWVTFFHCTESPW